MRKLFVILSVLLFISTVFAYEGDGLGDYKLKKALNANGQRIYDGVFEGDGTGITGVGLSTSTAVTINARAGENLTKGDFVYISGAIGSLPQVMKADFDSTTIEQTEAIGMAAETKNNGQAILIRSHGTVGGLDTSKASGNGVEIYLWESGDWTETITSSGVKQHVGHVINDNVSQGVIYVDVDKAKNTIRGEIGQDAEMQMGSIGGRNVFKDGQGNEIANITPSSMSVTDGFIIETVQRPVTVVIGSGTTGIDYDVTDYANVNACIQAAHDSFSNPQGGRIVLREIDAALVSPAVQTIIFSNSNVTLEGQGKSSRLICTGTGNQIHIQSTGCWVKNIYFDSDAGSPSSLIVIYSGGGNTCDGLKVTDCHFKSGSGTSYDIQIDSDTDSCLIENNIAEHISDTPAFYIKCRNGKIKGNVLKGNGGTDVYGLFSNDSHQTSFTDNTLIALYVAIEDGNDNRFVNNYVKTFYGKEAFEITTEKTLLLSNNTIIAVGTTGIVVNSADDSKFNDNIFVEATTGLELSASCNRCQVEGNNFYGTTAGFSNSGGVGTMVGFNVDENGNREPETADLILQAQLRDVTNGWFETLTATYSVKTNTVAALGADGLWFRNDGGTGGFNLHDDGSMDAKGSWNMEGHDVNGADDIAGQSLSITGEYSIGGADGADGDVLTTDGAGGVTFETPSGGAGFTTFYFQLSGGGDVWVATNSFIPISGCFVKVPTTWTITGVKFGSVYHSTQAATWYNIAHSTDTGASCTTVWSYIFDSDVEVSTSTKQAGWQEPDTAEISAYQYLALHITAIPGSGDLPSEFFAIIRYWRKDEFE